MRKFTKRAITVLLAIIMVIGIVSPATASGYGPHPFTDVQGGRWYSAAVQYVWETGVMQGVGQNQFAPNRTLTRAEVAAIYFRLVHGRDADATDNRNNPFNDVSATAWYAPYVTWLVNSGLGSGVTANQFEPNRPSTRQEFAVVLYNYAMSTLERTDTGQQSPQWDQFTDKGQLASGSYAALRWLNFNGIITGRTPTTISPNGSLTRAEAATMFARLYLNV